LAVLMKRIIAVCGKMKEILYLMVKFLLEVELKYQMEEQLYLVMVFPFLVIR